ncbi:MAG: glycerophosphodiester phosphodiesterase [Planctomycetota bacterium]
MKTIAHRGASGYVPEHTLTAKAMAHAMGAAYLEQDLVATKDGVPVVLHDIHLDTVTDVKDRFPDRKRADGRFYAIDFTVAELKTLRVFERFDLKTGRAVFAERYPTGEGEFRIPTFDEEIRFIKNLNRSTTRSAGIYPEIKQPAWHREQGCDLSPIVLEVLRSHGFDDPESECYLQCFDEFEVKRLRRELGYRGKLVQLIARGHDEASGTDYNRLRSAEGLADLQGLVDGVGPMIDLVVTWDDSGERAVTPFVEAAHANGLVVHPWTIRADQLPRNCGSLQALVDALKDAAVDGVFADHPDRVIAALTRSNRE